jgi:hypothetical protein
MSRSRIPAVAAIVALPALIVLAVLAMLAVIPTSASAQTPPAAAEKTKSLWEEHVLFAYIENSYVWNLGKTGRGGSGHGVNELRFYDFDAGYTFNIAEFSLKKDPSERYPFGYGLVVTAGIDSQKNHAIGIFRDDDDTFPFRNTAKFDLQEAYASWKFPVAEGLTLKAGKFVTLLGYEVIEAPNNLNFSRSLLFSFAIPLTHVGALLTLQPTEWLSLTAGPVVGSDVADDNNSKMSVMGQVAVTAVKDLVATVNFITGPEQALNNTNNRTVLDFIVTYTGIPKVTLGLNADFGWEESEAALVASGTRSRTDASWWGLAGYAAYDWTEQLRTAVRAEYFSDAKGVRTAATAAGVGGRVSLWEVTATASYKIWRGLLGRLEYRHDEDTDSKFFKIRAPGRVPTSRSQDTVTVALSYLFFRLGRDTSGGASCRSPRYPPTARPPVLKSIHASCSRSNVTLCALRVSNARCAARGLGMRVRVVVI